MTPGHLALYQGSDGLWTWFLHTDPKNPGVGGTSKTIRKAIKEARNEAKRRGVVIGYVYMDRRDTTNHAN